MKLSGCLYEALKKVKTSKVGSVAPLFEDYVGFVVVVGRECALDYLTEIKNL